MPEHKNLYYEKDFSTIYDKLRVHLCLSDNRITNFRALHNFISSHTNHIDRDARAMQKDNKTSPCDTNRIKASTVKSDEALFP